MNTSLNNNSVSNKKFGVFFSLVSLILYFYLSNILFLSLSLIFLFFSFFYTNALKPINNLWFKLGILLGTIVSPIVLGCIFFLLITPISVIGRVFQRNPLNLNLDKKLKTYWIKRDNGFTKEDFNNQF